MKNKRDKPEESGGGSNWLTTFNDMMTLLMVFFVLLYSLGDISSETMNDISSSLQGGLGVLEAGRSTPISVVEYPMKSSRLAGGETSQKSEVAQGKTDGSGGEAELEASDEPGSSEPSGKPADRPEESSDPLNQKDMAEQPGQPDQNAATEGQVGVALGSNPFAGEENKDGLKVVQTDQGMRITLSDNILFDLGVANLNVKGLPVLDRVVALVSDTRAPVLVEGHTDNLPIKSARYPSNWELSVARAVNVVKYLIEVGGIDPARLSAVGYGESKPLVPNTSPENRAKNRRVELLVETREG